MEFSEQINEGLQLCGDQVDDGALSELVSHCMEALIHGTEEGGDGHEWLGEDVDKISQKRIVASMLTFLTEAAKTDSTNELIVSFLEGNKQTFFVRRKK